MSIFARFGVRLLPLVWLTFVSAASSAGQAEASPTGLPDGAMARRSADEYAWRVFAALSRPPGSQVARANVRSSPHQAQVMPDDGPAAWEGWQVAAEVFLEDGADPGPWTDRPNATLVAERRFETASRKDFPHVMHVVDGAMVPLDNSATTANRVTEIRLNRVTFEYIRERELYNLEGQRRAYAAARPVNFPPGAMQIKAKWRAIRPDEKSRYHSVEVALRDGSTQLYGLVGLHLASKVLPHWLWATFEHVDNATRPDDEGWQLRSRDTFACRGLAADCNLAPVRMGLEGTVWQYYRLRGTLTTFVDARLQPTLLANSELETGMQRTASCITCHSRAALGVLDGTVIRLPIFDTSQNVAGSPGSLSRRGFYGLPSAAWFGGGDSGGGGGGGGGDSGGVGIGGGRGRGGSRDAGAVPQPIFRAQDFIWSLAKAESSKAQPPRAGRLAQPPALRPSMADAAASQNPGFELNVGESP